MQIPPELIAKILTYVDIETLKNFPMDRQEEAIVKYLFFFEIPRLSHLGFYTKKSYITIKKYSQYFDTISYVSNGMIYDALNKHFSINSFVKTIKDDIKKEKSISRTITLVSEISELNEIFEISFWISYPSIHKELKDYPGIINWITLYLTVIIMIYETVGFGALISSYYFMFDINRIPYERWSNYPEIQYLKKLRNR